MAAARPKPGVRADTAFPSYKAVKFWKLFEIKSVMSSVMKNIVLGISSRNYGEAVKGFVKGYGIKKSTDTGIYGVLVPLGKIIEYISALMLPPIPWSYTPAAKIELAHCWSPRLGWLPAPKNRYKKRREHIESDLVHSN